MEANVNLPFLEDEERADEDASDDDQDDDTLISRLFEELRPWRSVSQHHTTVKN